MDWSSYFWGLATVPILLLIISGLLAYIDEHSSDESKPSS